MMGHLNGCMLLGFRNENKNETLELLYPEPRRRKKGTLRIIITRVHFPMRFVRASAIFWLSIHISRLNVPFFDL